MTDSHNFVPLTASTASTDRVGLGWRPELAAGIFAHLDRIDLVEVIADDYFEGPSSRRNALRTLARQVPVVLHGVGLGLASCVPVDARRLDRMARLVDRVCPESWSEHLAFVRGGGVEIGHLAAPPRTAATMQGAADNIDRARRAVGAMPHMENIATLMTPPGSSLAESEWVAGTVQASGCPLLLDLHNVHANATNHGYDAADFLSRVPLDRVSQIHMAGGKCIASPDGRDRVLDDHRHDVPGEVYELLEEVAARVDQPLTVILERDGSFPAMTSLLGELDAMRAAVVRGRRRRRTGAVA